MCRNGNTKRFFRRGLSGGLLIFLIAEAVMLSGCSLPGATGAGGQQGPPALTPPPGLESGGARAVMAPAITAPNDSVLAFRYALAPGVASGPESKKYADIWHTCRRIVIGDQAVLIEGIDYSKTSPEGAENSLMLPLPAVGELAWKYEKLLSPLLPPGIPAAKESPAKENNK
jgi:hypothetical protein